MAASVVLHADQCKTWEKSGKNEFIKFCKSQVASGKSGWECVSKSDLKRAFYELCWHALRGALKVDQAAAVLADIGDMHHDIPSLVADVYSIIDMETLTIEEGALRDRFMNLLQASTNFIQEAVLKERLDPDTMENIGLLDSKQSFQSKYVKIKTKLYYKQQKFNLLREENEGYSKMVSELNQDLVESGSHQNLLENIRSLIGCFNLDPNRVLDIILEAFESQPAAHSVFVPLLSEYMNDYTRLCHILGFKFHFYQQTQDSQTPKSLYHVTALLTYFGLVDLDKLYPHLSPSDADIVERAKKTEQEAVEYARKQSVVVLSSDKKDDSKDKEKEEKDVKNDQQVNNQKLGLCEALLLIGDWPHAQKLLDSLPPYFAASNKAVATALCAIVHAALEPLYVIHSGLPPTLLKRRSKPEVAEAIALETLSTFEELPLHVFTILRYLGPNLSCDTLLMGKLLRIGRAFMEKRAEMTAPSDAVEDVFRGFITLLDETIFPSLSLLPGNCCMSEEVWSFLKLFKYEYRYRLYGQWKNQTYGKHPTLIHARADCMEKAKYIMKRLAKENVKQLGRQIGKLSHNNPAVLFEYILSQIQKYDNFIGPVVDSLKFLTSLAYDVLSYCIIEALANPERERMKTDDTNISLWLQSLASFSGAIFKKYQIDLAGLIQYVVNQLKAGKSYDLLILREVVQKMAGIEVSDEITDDQLEAMSGGDLLKVEGGCFTQVRNTKRSSSRLKEALLDHDLAIPLCLLMAQERYRIVFGYGQEDKRHLKLIGKLFDQCQDTFVQFTSFLSTSLTLEEFCKRLPPVDVLMDQYHLAPETAFLLSRTMYANNINAKYEELKKRDKKDKELSGKKVQRYIESADSVMSNVVELIQEVFPTKMWDDLSPQFYTTFWTLTMYDLHVPKDSYNKQMQQLKTQSLAIEDNKDMAPGKRKKEKERCLSLVEKLQDEEKRQQEHVNHVMARLKHDKDAWFPARSTKNMSVVAFLQHCVFPRCCFSSIDAVYCAQFIHTLHNLKTPNFSSLICYDRIFSDVTFSVTTCTENEVNRYGRFLCTALDSIMRWHSDKSIYEKECQSYPGFVTVFRNKGSNQSNSTTADHLDYENYRHVCHKWHFSLTKAMVACLESGNYIQIRNALILLTRIMPHYPKVQKFGHALERRVNKLRQEEREKRPDIYALAMGYCGQLNARKRTWISELDFHQRDKETQPKPAAKVNGTASGKENDTVNGTAKKESDTHSKEKRTSDGKAASSKSDVKDVKPEMRSVSRSNSTENLKLERKDAGDQKPTVKERRLASRKDKNGERDVKEKGEKPEKEKKEKREDKEKSHKEIKKEIKEEKEKRREEKEERKEKEKLAIKEEREREKHTFYDDREKYREERERERFEKEREKAAHREDRERMKEEKAALKAAGKELRTHKEKKEKRVKEERGAENDLERESSVASTSSHGSHGHRRSAEPSPKPNEEKEAKRRKIEGSSSGVKDNYHSADVREKVYKSPAYDRGASSSEWDRDRTMDREERKERKRHSGAYMDEAEPTKRYREPSPASSRASRVSNGDAPKVKVEKARSPKESARGRQEPEFGMAEMAVKARRDSPPRGLREKKHGKKSKK